MGSVLIVGGDGKVGRALAEQVASSGQTVITTSRRMEPAAHVLPLDLAGDVDAWPIPDNVTSAVICAAIPLIDACEKAPVGTARVNVVGTLALVRRLVERNVFTVFCSTNQVFDGETPHTPAETPQSPRSEYGRQKTRVEQELLSIGNLCAVVRFTKILEPNAALLTRWRDALQSGGTIEPFVDMRMAPVPLATAASTLRLIADRRAGGIWQVSGDRDVTYSEAAMLLAKKLGARSDQLRPISALESGRVTAHLPRNTTLCVERLRREFGLEPPAVEWTIDSTLERTT